MGLHGKLTELNKNGLCESWHAPLPRPHQTVIICGHQITSTAHTMISAALLEQNKRACIWGQPILATIYTQNEPSRLRVQYFVRALSDDWLRAEAMLPLSFAGLILPERMPPNTGV